MHTHVCECVSERERVQLLHCLIFRPVGQVDVHLSHPLFRNTIRSSNVNTSTSVSRARLSLRQTGDRSFTPTPRTLSLPPFLLNCEVHFPPLHCSPVSPLSRCSFSSSSPSPNQLKVGTKRDAEGKLKVTLSLSLCRQWLCSPDTHCVTVCTFAQECERVKKGEDKRYLKCGRGKNNGYGKRGSVWVCTWILSG